MKQEINNALSGKSLIILIFCSLIQFPIQGCKSDSDSSNSGNPGDGSAGGSPSYTIGGTVSELSATLVLQNNGGDNLTLTSNGSFTFATTLANSSSYNVTVHTQPTGQTCLVTNGSGSVSGVNVTNVIVTCSADTYTIGGLVSGLSGTIVLQNNGGDNLTLTSNGDFTFATGLANGATYNVSIQTQPSGQTCTVTNGSGSVSGVNVTNVIVDCPPAAWARTLSAGSSQSEFNGVATDGNGNVYAAGYQYGNGVYTYSTGVNATGTHTNQNVVLVKYSAAGTAQWAQSVSTGSSYSIFQGVAVDNSGNIYAAGSQSGTGVYTYGTNVSATGTSSSSNAVLVKYNAAGTAQWARSVSSGSSNSTFYSIAVDDSGNVYTAGYQYGNGEYTYGTTVSATGTSTNYNIVLVKYNSEGTAQWVRSVSTGSGESVFYGIAVDGNSNVYAAGSQSGTGVYTYGTSVSATGTSSSSNAVLVKYNAAGTAQWARSVSSGSSISRFRGVAVDGSGNVYAAGKQYGTGAYTYSTGVSITGTSIDGNVVLVKYNATGTAQWARTLSAGSYNSIFNGVAVDSGGNVYAAGYQTSNGIFTYGVGVSATGPSLGSNVVLVKYNASGTAQWARSVTGSSYTIFYGVAVDGGDNVYATGTQWDTGAYTYATGVSTAGTSTTGNVVLVKYNQ